MVRAVWLVAMCCLALVIVAGNGWTGDAKKEKDTTKVKGQLPAGWKDLNLTKEQTLQIYDLKAKFKGKLAALEEQIKDLKVQEKTELVKVLTPTQRELLRKLTIGDEEAPKKKTPDKDK